MPALFQTNLCQSDTINSWYLLKFEMGSVALSVLHVAIATKTHVLDLH